MDLDGLIEQMVSDAQLSTGVSAAWLAARGNARRAETPGGRTRMPRWTEAEERFYLENVGRLSYAEIAAALGRTVDGLHVHVTRKKLPTATRTPGYLTAMQAGLLLGLDSHKIPVWIDAGIFPGERLPLAGRAVRRVSLVQFKMWLVRPSSWVYFDAAKIPHASLRRLVLLAQSRWGDQWLTTTKAAQALGCEVDDINRQIKIGKLPGYQPALLGARHQQRAWGNWFVRRSHLEGLVIVKRKGGPGVPKEAWSARADAFLLRARAEGKTYEAIGRMMKWNPKRVKYRLDVLNGRRELK